MSSSVAQDIKQITKNTISSMALADLEVAKVVEEDEGEGIVVQVENYEPYPKKAIVVPEIFTKFEAKTSDGKTITIDNTLHKDDEVLLLRKPGGQLYVVIARTYKKPEEKKEEPTDPENPDEEKKCPCGCPWETCPNNPDNKKDDSKEEESGGSSSGGSSGSGGGSSKDDEKETKP